MGANGLEDTWFFLEEEGDGGCTSSLEEGGQWEDLARQTVPGRASQGPEGLCPCSVNSSSCVPCLPLTWVKCQGPVSSLSVSTSEDTCQEVSQACAFQFPGD